MLDKIEVAINQIKQGKMVIVVDDENRENEGDFIMAAQFADTAAINFMITKGKGLICAPLTQDYANRLDLPSMVVRNQDSMATAFTVSVDAAHGISTGISAADRAYTFKLLANPHAQAEDLVRPGHIFPLIAREGGVRVRPGHTEAAVDLTLLAGLNPVGVICEILNDEGECMRLPELKVFAQEYGLTLVSIEDLVSYLNKNETVLFPTQESSIEQSGRAL